MARFGTRRDLLRSFVALTTAAAASGIPNPNHAAAQTATLLPELPPMPPDTARENRNYWGSVPTLRGDANGATVTYLNRKTQITFNGQNITLSTTFQDLQNRQDITITQNLAAGSTFSFETLRALTSTQLQSAPRGNFAALSEGERVDLTTAMLYAQIDDLNLAREALQRRGINRAEVMLNDGPPSLPPSVLSEFFGGQRPDFATIRFPNLGVTAHDAGSGRGVSRVAGNDHATLVRYEGPRMAVTTSFLNRKAGKITTIRTVLIRGKQPPDDFLVMRRNLALVIDTMVPSLRNLTPTQKLYVAGAIVHAQLVDIGLATHRQLSLPNNSNAAALSLDTVIGSLPEARDLMRMQATLIQNFGAHPAPPVPELSAPPPARPPQQHIVPPRPAVPFRSPAPSGPIKT